MHDGWREKLVFLAPSFEFAAACREDVLRPLRVAAIGQSDDEPGRNSKHIYGCAVDLPRFAAHVSENAEAGEPACEQARDSVRHRDIELCQPSLSESHQQDGRGGNRNGDDGSYAHGLLILQDRIRFDFDQPIWVNETHNLHNGVRWSDVAKEFTVDCGDLFPVFYSN